jgi:hypothetical protein
MRAAVAAAVVDLGCAPTNATCTGAPDCSCMACACGNLPCSDFAGGLVCQTPTESRRAVKDDILYVDDSERAALAKQALGVRLAHYRYKVEPANARRSLGFVIDDMPDPSPAVLGDRAHVDNYGYTSLLLATVQEQARQLETLRKRVETLEARPCH